MVIRKYTEAEHWLRRRTDLDTYALMDIRKSILQGTEMEKQKMAHAAIDHVATKLLTPQFGITDYELITGEKPGDPKKIQEVLKNEVRMEYGIKMPYFVQEYMDIQLAPIYASSGEEELSVPQNAIFPKEDFHSIFKIN